ncbi:MAG: ParA family protein [SAR324 cluster bacterium]|nr:ParA family protein [SAR324 cluster bacterium]
MKVLAIYNIKGGVGKTSSAVNLAYLSTQSGARTLIWDLDPQGASSYYFRIAPKVKGGSKALIRQKQAIDMMIKGTDFENLDLIPADFSYRHMDLLLNRKNMDTRQFSRILKPLKNEYDFLFLDCPPSISLVSENVLQVSDAVIAPVIPTPLSLRTLQQLSEHCQSHQLEDLKIFPFGSMVDRRKKLHRECMELLPQKYPNMLKSYIPYSSDIEQMAELRDLIVHFSPRKKAALAFRNLWEEIQTIAW